VNTLPYPTPSCHAYRVSGLTLAGDFPFANLSPVIAKAPCDLTVKLVAEPPLGVRWGDHVPVHTAGCWPDDGSPLFALYRLPGGVEMLRFTRLADFYVWSTCIVCHLLDPDLGLEAEFCLLGTVLAHWAERRSIAVLHASAVVTELGAVGFLAVSGAGKSSLAATFMHAGHQMLTDDMLLLSRNGERWLGAPGQPQMRMWPETAEHFLGETSGLSRVHPDQEKLRVSVGAGGFGSFCGRTQPLAALYLPERQAPARQGDSAEIAPLSPSQAVLTLISLSYASRLLHGLSNQRDRFSLLVPLAQHVPVRRLVYPSGYEHLPRIRQMILDDLDSSRLRPPGELTGAIDGST